MAPPEIVAVEVALWEPFSVALQIIDAILRADEPFNMTKEQIIDIIDRWPVKSQARLARRVVDLANAKSESAMESLIRAIFILFGFEPPIIQAEFSDSTGKMYVDFYWPSLKLVIEYDGEGKWLDPLLATGKAQWDRIHQHNERHDRLLAQPGIDRVIHLTKEDVHDVNAFVTRMDRLGIPRDPRRVPRFPQSFPQR